MVKILKSDETLDVIIDNFLDFVTIQALENILWISRKHYSNLYVTS